MPEESPCVYKLYVMAKSHITLDVLDTSIDVKKLPFSKGSLLFFKYKNHIIPKSNALTILIWKYNAYIVLNGSPINNLSPLYFLFSP